MKNNTLLTSPCGERFYIYFGDGTRSIEYDLSEEGLRFIVGLAKSGKISLSEFWKMRDKVIGEVITFKMSEESPNNFLYSLFCSFENFDLEEFINTYNEEKTNIATFKMCKCGEFHGRIFFNGGLTDFISNIDEAMDCLDYLSQNGLVSQDELPKVIREVQVHFS